MGKTLEEISIPSACNQLLTLHGPQLARENVAVNLKAKLLKYCIAPEFFVMEVYNRIYPKIGSFVNFNIERYKDKFIITCDGLSSSYLIKIFSKFFDLFFYEKSPHTIESEEIDVQKNAFSSSTYEVYVANFFFKFASFRVGRGQTLNFDFYT